MTTHPDAWLFLPPEVEALVPELMAEMTGRSYDAELERVETLILSGDVDAWRDFLRTAAAVLASYDGPATEAQVLAAAILDDQFILARAVVDLEAEDVVAREPDGSTGSE
jgi:hypothetical protein